MRPLSTAPNARRRGMTLVETAIGATVMVMLLGLVALAVQRAGGAFRSGMDAGSTNAATQRAVERIARQFMDADRSSLVFAPTAPFAASSIEFARCQGFNAGALLLGPRQRVRFEYDVGELDDGRDNDGDGLIDEGRVVLNTDIGGGGRDVVLVEDVRELLQGESADGTDENGNGLADECGFSATYDPLTFTLTLRLTVETPGSDGGRVVRTAETAIRIRND